METPKTDTGGVPLSTPPASVPGVAGLGSSAASTEDERRKWREKGRLQRSRKKAALAGSSPLASPGAALSAPAPGASAVSPEPPGPPPVPWDPSSLKPLCEQIVTSYEKAQIEELKTLAGKVSEDLVPMVEKEAPWSPTAKVTLVES